MTKPKPTFTERAVGLGSALFGVLVGLGALHAGAGLLSVASAAFLGYVAAVVVLPMKIQADRFRVVLSTTTTVLIAAVITGIVFVGIGKAFRGLA